MKKLLTILANFSAIFLFSTTILLISKSSDQFELITYKNRFKSREHKIYNGVLKEVGYDVLSNGTIQIKRIDYKVKTIAAPLPEEITSLKGVFQTNTSMINWQTEWDTKNITDMSYAFYNTTWINEKSIANWNTSKVTNMEGMFGLSKAFNQDISNWDVSNVKNFKNMFSYSTEFNNGDKPLNWSTKLKNATNMQGMFQNASAFTQDLSGWIMNNSVNNTNFGLEMKKQPIWKVEVTKPTVPKDLQSDELSKKTERTYSTSNTSSSSNLDSSSNISRISSTPKAPIVQPSVSPMSDIKPKNPIEKNELLKPNNEVEALKEDKVENPKSDNNLYKIPSAKSNSIKLSSPNAGIIAGAVLGSFTILGTGAGLGYYYRKNLKNLYLKSADKIKPSLLKSKDNIKDFYVKSIDKTKNLYSKSKTKIKDKIAKIKSKK
ncbi:BspA family leucine-rich repeat surface protein [Mycoplasma capricolum]|uniref:BspA family leucine-rich repeat surface protein n=1 Tax=Mycoplasma capricolum TaxID=2095 RepID=UPI003DA630ED